MDGTFFVFLIIALVVWPFSFLTRCLDVFIVAYIFGKNGITGRCAKYVSLSFGLSALLMAGLAVLADHGASRGIISLIGLLPPLCSVAIYLVFKNSSGFFEELDRSKIFLLVLASLLTGADVFCEGIVTHFLLFGRSHSPILIIVDVVSATLVGYYAINLHRKKADDVTSIGCLIGALFVFYYIMYIVSGSVIGLRPD